MSKRLLHVSIAILCLALAYHVGARTSHATGGGDAATMTPTTPTGDAGMTVVTTTGDVFVFKNYTNSWSYHSNIFSGKATPVDPETIGKLKARYR